MNQSKVLALVLAASLSVALGSAPLGADATAGQAGAAIAQAAMAKDAAAVRKLLKEGGDVNGAQGDGMTALHWAALNGDAELASMLLFAGANVGATHPHWRLHAAPSRRAGRSRRRDRPTGRRRRAGECVDRHRRHRADAGGALRQHRCGAHPARERRRSECQGNRQRPDGVDVRGGGRSRGRGAGCCCRAAPISMPPRASRIFRR